MRKIEAIEEIHKLLHGEKNIVFVPTMGNLHAGHLSLIDKAISISNNVIVSIFVNPIQFNSNQDLESYPRTLDQDIKLLSQYKDLIVFVPQSKEIYPENPNANYDLPAIARDLCGIARPGHFNGVITVIDRLFSLIKPHVAIFGKKDYQQLFLIKEFSRLKYPSTEIIGMPTFRDENGLALSSRNNLFKESQLIKASNFYRTLNKIAHKIESGQNYNKSIRDGINGLEKLGWSVDYIEVRRAFDLQSPAIKDTQLIILGAAIYKNIRLIDNIEFCIDSPN